ncbi:MAG: hypothetical protein AMJ68_02165 [Acidithiobacillales bacterium SG8_45]|jgi:hypothetical protein|nr:MAG: hypothetical protein AMJ68_02165 [Acidithiobacillales bacterium SG8_45]
MIFNNARLFILFAALLLPLAGAADDWEFGGHVKYQASVNLWDATSIFGSGGSVTALDQNANLRLKAEKRDGSWDYKIHYELGVLYGHTLEALRALPSIPYPIYALPNDNNRLFNLTSVIYDEGRGAAAHRLDRASVGYASGNFVFRAGRDAISWGNGVVYQPMDIFNPFSPTSIDKEYKSGDDMVYSQWLLPSGSDMQLVAVPRRNPSGTFDTNDSSLAGKFRGLFGSIETDILLARHYNESFAGLGLAADWRGAVLRSDSTISDTPDGVIYSGVSNISYSWVWANHNVTGFAEYYRNGFGISNGDYSTLPQSLLDRFARGEVFNLGQDNGAAGLTIELTPRWQFSPTVFANLNDASTLWQFAANYDWKENGTLLLGGIIPVGPLGTEYGGIPIGGGQYYRPAISVYARLAYYF